MLHIHVSAVPTFILNDKLISLTLFNFKFVNNSTFYNLIFIINKFYA